MDTVSALAFLELVQLLFRHNLATELIEYRLFGHGWYILSESDSQPQTESEAVRFYSFAKKLIWINSPIIFVIRLSFKEVDLTKLD